jgi:hypothetical protein
MTPPRQREGRRGQMREPRMAEVRLDPGTPGHFRALAQLVGGFDRLPRPQHAILTLPKTPERASLAHYHQNGEYRLKTQFVNQPHIG